jgi:hypothetical protein
VVTLPVAVVVAPDPSLVETGGKLLTVGMISCALDRVELPPTVLYSDSGTDVEAVASGPIVTGSPTIAQSCATASNVAVDVSRGTSS